MSGHVLCRGHQWRWRCQSAATLDPAPSADFRQGRQPMRPRPSARSPLSWLPIPILVWRSTRVLARDRWEGEVNRRGAKGAEGRALLPEPINLRVLCVLRGPPATNRRDRERTGGYGVMGSELKRDCAAWRVSPLQRAEITPSAKTGSREPIRKLGIAYGEMPDIRTPLGLTDETSRRNRTRARRSLRRSLRRRRSGCRRARPR
jgi:hypothetical protein